MAKIGAFDASTIDPLQSYELLPAGEYNAMIVASDMKPTQKGNGAYLELEFSILDEQHQGRKLWSRLNLDNPSVKAVLIAQRELSAICHAVGKLQIQDSDELHDIPMLIDVIQKAGTDGVVRNEIDGYAPATSTGKPAGTPAPRVTAPGAAFTGGRVPPQQPWAGRR